MATLGITSSNKGSTGVQIGRLGTTSDSLNNLNNHELNQQNRIIDEHYNKTQETILDKPFGVVINNTINFFGNSFDTYYSKLIEAEFTQKLYNTDNSFLNTIQKHLIALSLFIRDDENIIYLGFIMVILSVLICFFNISRSYGHTEISSKP
jgi:hypothetical protein